MLPMPGPNGPLPQLQLCQPLSCQTLFKLMLFVRISCRAHQDRGTFGLCSVSSLCSGTSLPILSRLALRIHLIVLDAELVILPL
jgi:hypothetical protein